MSDRISWHRFARPADVPTLERDGWRLEPESLGPTHGYWSVLMTWGGEGEPPLSLRHGELIGIERAGSE